MRALGWFGLGGLAIAACREPGDPVSPAPSPPPPSFQTIVVTPTGRTIAVDDTLRFQATTHVQAITAFTWGVSNPFATIDPTGLLRAVRRGQVSVRACGVERPFLCGSAPLLIQ